MKEVLVAKTLGMCSGVKRALDMLNTIKDSNIYVLGSLVHNPQIIERLKRRGIRFVSSIDDLYEGTVVISAHGTPLHIKYLLEKKGIKVVDATCPLVQKIYTKTLEFEKNGYNILILGDKEHAEVRAITANLKRAVVLEDIKELPSVLKHEQKTVLVSQTTQDIELFDRAGKELLKVSSEHRVFNTICNATKLRQDSAKNTAEKADMMVVIGGYNSANTRRLREICSRIVETRHIETAKQLRQEWFDGINIIGVTAGASTPEWIINDVIEKVKKF